MGFEKVRADPAPWPAAERLKAALRPHGLVLGIALEKDAAADLAPAEVALGRGVAPSQLDDLRRGRTAARRALRTLGASETTVLREPNGAPVFPDGFVGSISHTAGRALAAVGRTEQVGGLGVDVEKIEPGVQEDLADLIPLAERQAFATCFGLSDDASAIARFSLSESVYKAASAHLRRWIDFDECRFHPERDRRIAISACSLDLAAVLDGAECKLETDGSYVFSAVWLPAHIREKFLPMQQWAPLQRF
jgi:enterobactin synthetase component D